MVGRSGKTPLSLAAARGDAGLVEVLLAHKASPHTVDKEGYTPLLVEEIRRGWQRDTRDHQALTEAVLDDRPALGQVRPAVDAQDDIRIRSDEHPDRSVEQRQDVGQVDLTLRVVATHSSQRTFEFGPVEDVQARIDLLDRKLRG